MLISTFRHSELECCLNLQVLVLDSWYLTGDNAEGVALKGGVVSDRKKLDTDECDEDERQQQKDQYQEVFQATLPCGTAPSGTRSRGAAMTLCEHMYMTMRMRLTEMVTG